jgi:hypothetical protein
MTRIAGRLESHGYKLWSGGADGADRAFANGCVLKDIFVPWKGFSGLPMTHEIPEKAYVIAKEHHPAWTHLRHPVRALMARNVMQVLGPTLETPADFMVCWTPDGCIDHFKRTPKTGGTGQAISIASKYHIPVYNLARIDHRLLFESDFDPSELTAKAT